MLDTRQRLTICHQCRAQPNGCWRLTAPKDPRQRLQAGAIAATRGACPIGKWGEAPPPSTQSRALLIPPANPGPVDVVYFLGPESQHDDWELRYSLRSIAKHFKDLGRVFIIGHKPHWLRDVEHLDVPDRHKHNKDANLIEKLLAACRWGASPWFLNPSDDQILLKPVSFADIKAFHGGDLATMPASFWGPHKWKDRLRRTMTHLVGRGLPAFHHDCHVPFPIHRDTFSQVMGSVDFAKGPGYTIHTLYGNSAPIERVPIGRRKVTYEHACYFKFNIDHKLNDPEALFLGYSDTGMTPQFMDEIEYRFPEPSPWEADVPPRCLQLQTPDQARREALSSLLAEYGLPAEPPDFDMPPATLLFHFCPWMGRPEMISFHVRCLSRYLPQFSKVRINLVTGQDFADPDELEARLRAAMRPGADVKFFRNPHTAAERGETVPFFRDLLPEAGDEETVCYGHSKGAMLSPMPGGRAWGEFMYEATMGRPALAFKLLETHPCAGAFVRPSDRRGAKWHYAGTFFWFRNVRTFAGWNEFNASRYGVESWLGRFVPLHQAGHTLGLLALRDLTRNRRGLCDRYTRIPWGTS